MIINNLDNSEKARFQKIFDNKALQAKIIIAPKKVDLKDFLYHHPVFRSNVVFGASSEQGHSSSETQTVSHNTKMTLYSAKKALDFADSINMYFKFQPDKKQVDAAASLYNGDDTIVTAPTGTGKTLIAEYVIKKNLAEGKDTIYTTPLKALSNEKYRDFCKMFGEENVGLLTGDIKINTSAPIQVMTTEIYRNKLMGESPESLAKQTKHLATVIYDEFHMMNDPERGEVWETSVMYTPPHVQQLALSATANNDKAVTDWFSRSLAEKKRKEGIDSLREARLIHVSPKERHVPLKYFMYDDNEQKNFPLIIEKYNFQKICEAAKPDASEPLFELQKEVLQQISKKAGGEGTVEHGVQVLSEKLSFKDGAVKVERMEKDLKEKLGFEETEAQRIASLLQDRSERIQNPILTEHFNVKGKKSKDSGTKAYKVLIKPSEINNNASKKKLGQAGLALLKLVENEKCEPKEKMKFALKRLLAITGGQDMPAAAFENKLVSSGIAREAAAQITEGLQTKVISDAEQSPEIRLAKVLVKEEKDPVLFFRFSKRDCDELRKEFLQTGESLLSIDEKKKAEAIIKKHLDKGAYLGVNEYSDDLLTGVAVHHAGKMPGYKELVEELAQNKLIKLVFTTETIGMGINVPAKTAVLTEVSKYCGVDEENKPLYRDLASNEFHQMTGRAGRRGYDYIGNVIIMPDKKHPPESLYKMATAPADNLISNFKPKYSFISHFVTLTKYATNIEESVDRSFLRESLVGGELNPDVVVKGVKDKFKKMSQVVTDAEMGFFKGEDGNLTPTIKGHIATKAMGIHELLFASLMTEAPLEKLAPQQLAVVACALTEGNPKTSTLPVFFDDKTTGVLNQIDGIKEKIRSKEAEAGLEERKIEPNRYEAQFVEKWVQESELTPIDLWEKVVKQDMAKAKDFDEGDLFKTVNRTAEVVKQIKDVADSIIENPKKYDGGEALVEKMKIISQNAKEAFQILKKPPVFDTIENEAAKAAKQIR